MPGYLTQSVFSYVIEYSVVGYIILIDAIKSVTFGGHNQEEIFECVSVDL